MAYKEKSRIDIIFKIAYKYSVSFIFLLFSLTIAIIYLSSPSVENLNELALIKGKLKGNSFSYKKQGRTLNTEFYIWTKEYPSIFEIRNSHVSLFDIVDFEKYMHRGDSIKLLIPKTQLDRLTNNSKIAVYSIYGKEHNYLKPKETILKDKNNQDPYIIIAFLSAGILFYFLIKKRIIKIKY